MIRLQSSRILLMIAAIACLYIGKVQGQQHDGKEKLFYDKIDHWLQEQDSHVSIGDIVVTDMHTTDHNGVTHVYFIQYFKGLPIHGSLSNISFKGDMVFGRSAGLVPDIATLVLEDKEQYNPSRAVLQLATHLDYPFASTIGRVQKSTDSYGDFIVTDLPYARGEVMATAVWAKDEGGVYHRSWKLDLETNVNSDHYEAVVSGLNGKVLSMANQTVSCKFHDKDDHGSHNHEEVGKKKQATLQRAASNALIDGSQYRVFAPPLESPNEGERSLIVDPSDAVASPHGWHDVDNVAGAEYTITRGNNVHAYQDPENDDDSNGDEPEGGENLIFDFPFSRDSTPEGNLDADVTNLFFWNNYLHDWSYQFGFNEAAGNFQEENFGRGGRAGDHVNAQTLDGGDIGNANFSAPRDGDFGRMQMYKWIVGNDLTIVSPPNIAGDYNTGGANFGPSNGNNLTEIAAIATDGIGESTDVCETINNSEEITGRVAIVDRGTCDFSFKVFNAQSAGAVAVLVCNNLDDAPLITMSGGANADEVTIPSLFLSKEDCQLIKDEIDRDVTLRFNETFELSSSFDNGIVAHEYGHGISLRLVGGANNSGCLNNDENVGEGWSDFFGMILTQKETDARDRRRGIGTYVLGEDIDGGGIRRYPYSTDMSINPQVLSHVRASLGPHSLGEIWASTLWDMYWGFIDQYGFDPTWKDRNSGNFRVVQIVIDGMKLQGCNAGMISARDALLEADQLNYFGENELLMWTAFARRGLGYDAIGGDPDDRYDNTDGFSLPPSLSGEIVFEKNITETVNVGDVVNVQISLDNNKEDLQDVVFTDVIPDGLEVITSSSDDFTVENGIISFSVGDVSKGSSAIRNYQLSTTEVQAPEFLLFDNFEGPLGFAREQSNRDVPSWNVSTAGSAGGVFSLSVVGDTLTGESYAINREEIDIADDNKLLKFQHRFETELGIDGGVVEISTDGGDSWEFVSASQFLVRPYNDILTFDNRYINTTPAFTGVDDSWDASVIDLSQYAGESLFVRFRYILTDFVQAETTAGWAIDNFEIYDRKEFVGEAILMSGNDVVDRDTATVYINSDARITPTEEVNVTELSFLLSPNPAQQEITLSYLATNRGDAGVLISNSNGQVVISSNHTMNSGQNEIKIDINALPAGVYTLQLTGEDFKKSENFVKVQ